MILEDELISRNTKQQRDPKPGTIVNTDQTQESINHSNQTRKAEQGKVEGGDVGLKSTFGTKRTKSTHGETIATRHGVKSMRNITDTLGVESSIPISKTFVRPSPPQELLDYPVIMSKRVTMNIFITSPLYGSQHPGVQLIIMI